MENQRYYWKEFRQQVLDTHRGKFVVYSQQDHQNPSSIIECIGCEGYENEVVVLLLRDSEIPKPQPEEKLYTTPNDGSLPFSPRCFYGVNARRWCVIPVLLKNGEYHGVTFLYDTGAHVTSLEPKTRNRLFKTTSFKLLNSAGHIVRLDLCGINLYVKFSEEYKNIHASNVNILGMDFASTTRITDQKQGTFILGLKNKHRQYGEKKEDL